jgi:hypothetical protein
MMAGAIDGLGLGKPLILSRQPTLQEYFPKGVIFVENEPTSIVQGIKEFQKLEEQLMVEIALLRDEKYTKWQESLSQLQKIIGQNA